MKRTVAAFLIAAVGTTSTAVLADDTPRPPSGPRSPLIVRLSDECVVAPETARNSLNEFALLGALAVALAPKLAGGIYNWVTGLISKAAEKKEITRNAASGAYFYKVGATGKAAELRTCVQMFTLGPKGTTWESLTGDAQVGQRIQAALKMKNSPGPDFFLELALLESVDKQFFRLVPTHLKFANAFSGSKRDTNLVVAVTMKVPGAKDQFASSAFQISGIRADAGAIYDLASLVGMDGEWNPKPEASTALQARLATPPTPTTTAQVFNAVNVSVAVTETQEANALLQSVAAALADSQKDVVTAIGSALPTEANRETAETAAIDAKNAYVEAVASAAAAAEEEKAAQVTRDQAQTALAAARTDEEKSKAQLTLATAEAALQTKKAATVKARAEANKAAIKAQMPQPFPDIYK